MIAYTGNGSYCYANSLHMCLKTAGADPLPDPGILEALTLMPFGAHYIERESGPVFLADLAPIEPDQGLTIAMRNLGWECEKWWAPPDDSPDEAFAHLRSALEAGPALLGPLDMGHLTYNPRAASTSDHFVVALELANDHVVVHDPHGFPFATLPLADLIEAWRAVRIGYAPGAFTLRSAFRRVESVEWPDVAARTLASLRETLSSQPIGPLHFGGPFVFRRVAQLLRDGDAPASLGGLQYFALPLGARRCQDGARFLTDAGLAAAAAAMERKALLYGRAQFDAVHERWPAVADSFDHLAQAEEDFIAALLT